MSEQMNIFECLYPNFKPKKKIRLIELFAGYGSQAIQYPEYSATPALNTLILLGL